MPANDHLHSILSDAKERRLYVTILSDFAIQSQGRVHSVSNYTVTLIGSKLERIHVSLEKIVTVVTQEIEDGR